MERAQNPEKLKQFQAIQINVNLFEQCDSNGYNISCKQDRERFAFMRKLR